MEEDRFFCAASSRASGESIYGTVALVRSWLLIEYPGPWSARAIEESPGLSWRVKAHTRESESRGAFDRALLIRREHRRREWIHAFSVRSCGTPRITQHRFCHYEELLALPDEGEPVNGLLYAVCTHGRHDQCCAKFGLPAYRALREIAGSRVWECSHVGGDRFAGNVVVFPYGLYYGRVTPEDVPDLVSCCERGEIWLKGYRGRSCYRRPVQVAEYFARVASGRLGIDEFQPILVSPALDGTRRVELKSRSDGSVHRIVFATRTEGLVQRVTCADLEPAAVPQYELLEYEILRP